MGNRISVRLKVDKGLNPYNTANTTQAGKKSIIRCTFKWFIEIRWHKKSSKFLYREACYKYF